MNDLVDDISRCTLCKTRFAATATRHAPHPVVWFAPEARILIAGQAPGLKVHTSGKPFTDRSGDRLRAWMDIGADTFYDRSRIAIVPMAFCFPGYSAKGSDLPPPAICATTWRDRVMTHLPQIRLTLVVGGHAMKYHLKGRMSVTQAVGGWKDRDDDIFVLPHPSWRNTGWLKRNPWFAQEVLPSVRARIKEVLDD